jgi:hypothetical protein
MPGRFSKSVALLLGAGLVALTLLSAAGPRDDRAATVAALAPFEIEGGTAPLVQDPVKRSRDLLERATRMRNAGDDVHARLAEAAALQWAKVAQDLVRSADAEATAQAARSKALDASASSERERAMLEQQLAQNGRLQAELRALEADGGKK